MPIRPRSSHAHGDADVRGGVDQAVDGEDVVALSQPAHLAGREAEFFRRCDVLEFEFGDAAEDALAQLRAQGGAGRFGGRGGGLLDDLPILAS
jgi:hypothetical protein